MYIDNSSQAFARLCNLNLITADQKRVALAHPQRVFLKTGADLAAHLVWLVEQRIVSHRELDEEIALPDGASEELEDVFHTVLRPALNELEERCADLNAPLYDRLLGYRLLTTAERQRAASADTAYVWSSAGQALASLVSLNIVTPERFEAMRQSAEAERHLLDGVQRAAIVGEAQLLMDRAKAKAQRGARPPARSRQVAWLAMLSIVVLFSCLLLSKQMERSMREALASAHVDRMLAQDRQDGWHQESVTIFTSL